jgi:transposase
LPFSKKWEVEGLALLIHFGYTAAGTVIDLTNMKKRTPRTNKRHAHPSKGASRNTARVSERSKQSNALTRAQEKAQRKRLAVAVLVRRKRPKHVARSFGVSVSQVYAATQEFKKKIKWKDPRLTLDKKLRGLAERIRKGEFLTHIAREEKVDAQKLSKVCRKMGIILRRGRRKNPNPGPPKQYKNVDWSLTDAAIGAQIGSTRQAVNLMRHKLIRLGFVEPRERRLGYWSAGRRLYQSLLGRTQLMAPQKRANVIVARTKQAAETAQELIRTGRAHHREYKLTVSHVLRIARGLTGRRRAQVISAIAPLMELPLNESARNKLFAEIDGAVKGGLVRQFSHLEQAILAHRRPTDTEDDAPKPGGPAAEPAPPVRGPYWPWL